jgi:hypothetical protein
MFRVHDGPASIDLADAVLAVLRSGAPIDDGNGIREMRSPALPHGRSKLQGARPVLKVPQEALQLLSVRGDEEPFPLTNNSARRDRLRVSDGRRHE